MLCFSCRLPPAPATLVNQGRETEAHEVRNTNPYAKATAHECLVRRLSSRPIRRSHLPVLRSPAGEQSRLMFFLQSNGRALQIQVPRKPNRDSMLVHQEPVLASYE